MQLASFLALAIAITACGGGRNSGIQPIVLSVALSNSTINLSQGGTVYTPVTIVAPTETASFVISGLPAGVSQNYKESESNPSGLLTLTASAAARAGAYKPIITVGSSGQTASLVFTLVITASTKAGTVSGTE